MGGPLDVAALADALGAADKASQRRAADEFVSLAARGIAVEAALHAALVSGCARQRWGAAFTLARLGSLPRGAIPVLLEALGMPDGDVRWAAADILIRQGMAAGAALAALARDGAPAQRKMALYCLRELGAWTAATDALARGALADADAGVRLAAMASLARQALDRAAASAAVSLLLRDPVPGVRRAAAVTLGRLGVDLPAVRAALETAAAGNDPWLARAAAGALGRLG